MKTHLFLLNLLAGFGCYGSAFAGDDEGDNGAAEETTAGAGGENLLPQLPKPHTEGNNPSSEKQESEPSPSYPSDASKGCGK